VHLNIDVEIQLNIDVEIHGYLRPEILWVKSISFFQCLRSGCMVSGELECTTISLPFDTRQSTNRNSIFGTSGRLLFALLN
jgi:hypothetical protein